MIEKNMRIQKGIIHNPNDEGNTKVPTMPLLIVLGNGEIWEAKTIRGVAAIIMGNEYLDCEDGIDEWHMRVEAARKEAMKALAEGINAVVHDSRKGIIENNYAVEPGDPDYEEDPGEPISMPVKIRVENDRLFILSLMQIGAIKVLERDDSYLLRPHPRWDLVAQSGGAMQRCIRCQYKIEDPEEGLICPVYNQYIKDTDGDNCCSYALKLEGCKGEYTGGTYIDLAAKYDINELFKKVGQEWTLNK